MKLGFTLLFWRRLRTGCFAYAGEVGIAVYGVGPLSVVA